jgi:hypothetical protein
MSPDQLQHARQLEDQMYEAKQASGQITADSHKRAEATHDE